MFAAIDIGKTTTRVASTKDLRLINKVERFPTLTNLADEKAAIKESMMKVCDSEQVKFVCVGMPGILDKTNQLFFKMQVWPELNMQPYNVFLQKCIEGSNVFFENDAALAGFGEAIRGAGKEFDIVTYLTLSTGVGGIRLAMKEIDPTFYFSEPGHMIINEDGPEDTCGQKGCLQAFVSGPAFEKLYNVKPEECNDEKIWTEYAGHLGSGIINIISMWAPEAIIIGGGMAKKFDFFYPSLVEKLNSQTFFPVPEIRKSSFGDDSGIQGGFAYISKFI